MKKLLLLFLLLVLATLGCFLLLWDSKAPSIAIKAPPSLGRNAQILIEITDEGRGLREFEVIGTQGSRRDVLAKLSTPTLIWPWDKSEARRVVTVSPAQKGFKQGELQIQVRAVDQPSLFLFDNTTTTTQKFLHDLRPPTLAVLSQQHYIRQGGSETILYRVSEDAEASGVLVGNTEFRGYPVSGQKDLRICLFALAWDQPVTTPMFLFARDQAGNVAKTGFWKKVFPTAFRQRDLPLTDEFLQTVVPQILANTDQVSEKGNLLDSYLEINRTLRKINNQQIADASLKSAATPLWSKPFLQLANSQVEAVFADRRSYFYQGKKIDEQTHLGFDLATSAQNPVEAANDGVVAFAEFLGIYGNCVIVDHGLGLQSLYGHLSSIDVKPGDRVKLGQTLGRTGMTGLAGGDHLHFSMVLQGVQINPVEWWDPKWVELHVMSRLRGEFLAGVKPVS